MSHKQGQEYHSSYVDGVRVKIAEQYKPPPKITLPTSYSQRIALNKQIQDNVPKYDFTLEMTVKEKMKEWREARAFVLNQRKERVQRLKDIKEKKKELANKCEESDYNLNITKEMDTEVLIPTQAKLNMLTPIPFRDLNSEFKHNPIDKSPFNISDFEADTSSPFDNMALKTINDMAELALVLQNEEKPTVAQPFNYNLPLNAAYTQTYNNTFGNPEQYLYQPSTSTATYVQPTNSYTASNGYYYDGISNYAPLFVYNKKEEETFDVTAPKKIEIEDNKIVHNKVPDIMKSLQQELNNIQINLKENNRVVKEEQVSSHKEMNKSVVESRSEMVDECFKNLPQDLQKLSKDISGMGFPLSRVSRVCQIIGNDHKKIVEHLLAMSELLDLGFQENQVSRALLECDNDRDKALDKLIL